MSLDLHQVTDTLIHTGLLTESILQRTTESLLEKQPNLSASVFLDELVANGQLTPFQTDEIRNGQGNSLLMGNYLLLSKLGEGGMGTVFKAMHVRMKREVALKTLKPDVAASEEFMERFYREVHAAARLNHPNAVAAYDADECELGHFLVMEFVDGDDLSNIVKRNGPLSVSEAVSAIRQAAEAFEYAHSQGIVHRDIKPANLMRDAHGVVKVADLGLAQLEVVGNVEKQAELTREGATMGTVDYMAPEQAVDSSSVDHRADIYSLGCTLFYLLNGRSVYRADSLVGRLLAHRQQPIPSLAETNTEVPPELDQLFQRMLAKEVDDRIQSMHEVVEVLKTLEADEPPQQWDPQSTTVYLVEPSTFQAKVLKRYLADVGVDDVHQFKTATDALEHLPELRPHAVLSSFQLPDMSGPELAQRMRADARWSLLPFVLMNGAELTAETVAMVQESAAMHLIDKPFSSERLERALKKTIEESSGGAVRFANLEELDVLIVDDSSVARRNIQTVLKDIGFAKFVHANDGAIAVDLMKTSDFDLIVTDYNMPEMNGYQLVEFIRKQSRQPDVPVVMVTTEYDPQKLADVYQLGVSAICNKSFDPELVRNIVQRLFK